MDDIFSSYSESYGNNIDLKKDFVVTYDTSTLLDLYRFSDEAREDVLAFYSKIDKKIGHFLTNHVALEFSRNKDKTKNDSEEKLNDIRSKFNTFKKSLKNVSKVGSYNTPIHDVSKEISPILDDIERLIPKGFNNKNRFDDLYDRVSKIFSSKVSEPYSNDMLLKVLIEGERRYSLGNIPPGYKDVKKDQYFSLYGYPVENKYGDFLIWKQLIDYSAKENKNIVLISSDKKEDWIEGRRIRPDLALEFKNRTGMNIYLFTLGEFVSKFKGSLHESLSSRTSVELADIEKGYDSWFDEVVNAFENIGGVVKLQRIYDYIEKNTSRNLPITWNSIVRRTIYNHSSDVDAYLGKKDVFEKVSDGKWKLR